MGGNGLEPPTSACKGDATSASRRTRGADNDTDAAGCQQTAGIAATVSWSIGQARAHRDRRLAKGRPVVADHTSDDRPAAPTNGAIKGEEKSGLLADAVARDDEQTRSDQDQTLSDADQTGSDTDQTTADSDEAASERDQAASDRVRAQGGDPVALDVARDLRDRGSLQREQSARTRLASAAARDQVAHERDLA